MMVPFVLSISAIQKTKKHSISLSIKMSHQCYHQHFSMPQNTRQSWRPSPNANALLKNTNVSFLYYTIKIRGTRMTHFWPDHHRKYQKWPKILLWIFIAKLPISVCQMDHATSYTTQLRSKWKWNFLSKCECIWCIPGKNAARQELNSEYFSDKSEQMVAKK